MILVDLQQKWKGKWDYNNNPKQELVEDLHNAGYTLIIDTILDPWLFSSQPVGYIYSLEFFSGNYLRTVLLRTPDLFL